jgi:hypothetical protein
VHGFRSVLDSQECSYVKGCADVDISRKLKMSEEADLGLNFTYKFPEGYATQYSNPHNLFSIIRIRCGCYFGSSTTDLYLGWSQSFTPPHQMLLDIPR